MSEHAPDHERFLAAVPALPVSDVARAVAFWVQVLGFTEPGLGRRADRHRAPRRRRGAPLGGRRQRARRRAAPGGFGVLPAAGDAGRGAVRPLRRARGGAPAGAAARPAVGRPRLRGARPRRQPDDALPAVDDAAAGTT
nr:hypothetical protein [Angustibacter aerolatus]